MENKILYIEACNYIDFPVGGQLAFAKQMVKVFGNELKLVGVTTTNQKVGGWSKILLDEKEFDFFPIHRNIITAKKPLVPRRITAFLKIRKYKKKILKQDYDIIVTRAPEIVLAIKNWPAKKKVYYFAGTGNPLTISRRWYGRLLASFYDRMFFPALKKFQVVLAAADLDNIRETAKRSKGVLQPADIIQFPTRIDTDIFCPKVKEVCRKKHNMPENKKIIVTTGRLHWAKGWEFMLDSYKIFLNSFPDSIFYFIGDGNARPLIEDYIANNYLKDKVILLGFQSHKTISEYLNAADIYVMGSIMEGWATSLVEAKACAVPICTTVFSSAKDLIQSGVVGYVVEERKPRIFASKMEESLNLKPDIKSCLEDMKKYSIFSLKDDILKIIS